MGVISMSLWDEIFLHRKPLKKRDLSLSPSIRTEMHGIIGIKDSENLKPMYRHYCMRYIGFKFI